MNFVKATGTGKGRGVFAARDYEANSIVEESPVIILSVPYGKLPKEIQDIVFAWDQLAGDSGSALALALGFGSLYNSANPSNMRYEADKTNNVLRFIAVRNIYALEELTINYAALGGGSESPDEKWFDRHGVAYVP
jgi:uncharacterized protein